MTDDLFLDETKYCPIYLCNEDVWYQILLNLKMCNIITQSLALKTLNEMVHLNNGFKKYTQLSNSIIDKKKRYHFFMESYDELIDNLTFRLSFIDCLSFKYRLENLKNEFCITKILCHLLFCNRSPALSSPYR